MSSNLTRGIPMSDRPTITSNVNKPLINAASMATSITGPATNINMRPSIGYDLTWTGSPVGTFDVEVSNSYSQDPEGNVVNAGSWTILPVSSFQGTYPVPSGTASNGFLDIEAVGSAWIRIVYNATSGSGNLTVIIASKVY